MLIKLTFFLYNLMNKISCFLYVFRCGVDYPISFFYKEIMVAFPNAKVSGRLIFNIHFLKLCYPTHAFDH
jgi:hypothetical protein